jgi:hypothetical protein
MKGMMMSNYIDEEIERLELLGSDISNLVWKYLNDLKIAKAQAEIIIDGLKEEQLRCEDCKEVNNTVKKTTCPYQSEVHGKEEKAVLCDKCYQERIYET